MSLDEKLDRVLTRHGELSDLMNHTSGPGVKELACELADLAPAVTAITAYRRARQDLLDAEAMLDDADMRELASQEAASLKKRLPLLEQAMKSALRPKAEADTRDAILEVRAGTGGDEAALFATELYQMYKRYVAAKGWQFEPIAISETGIGGCKEATARIVGHDVFGRLKYESGVHRVQRVPATESAGRVHTSAVTVAVMPEAKEMDVTVEDKDLRIDTYRSQGSGGQHVNTTDSAVRITYIPTGLVVACQEERSQHKNKAKAMALLRAKLYDEQRRKNNEEQAAFRRSQVGSGDRSERVRTYNFPQRRVTDHRVNLTLYKLEQMMTGQALDEIIDALSTEEQAAKLADLK